MIDYEKTLNICVDFDGTIVEHKYPEIGDEMLFAFSTLKALKEKGHRLILWTYREGEDLEAAIQYCRENGLEFYSHNESYPGERKEKEYPRKPSADLFIDDRNIGGFLGWDKIWQMIHPEGGELDLKFKNPEAHHNYKKNKGGFIGKLFGKRN